MTCSWQNCYPASNRVSRPNFQTTRNTGRSRNKVKDIMRKYSDKSKIWAFTRQTVLVSSKSQYHGQGQVGGMAGKKGRLFQMKESKKALHQMQCLDWILVVKKKQKPKIAVKDFLGYGQKGGHMPNLTSSGKASIVCPTNRD